MNALVKQTEPKAMEYVPFGAADKIRLTVDIVKKLCCTPTRSGKVCDDTQAVRFMAMCQAQRLNPFAGDAFLIGYDGRNGAEFSLITAHQAFLKRAESSDHFDGMESGIIVRVRETGEVKDIEGDFYLPDEVDILGGWAIVHHKGHKIPTRRRIRLERFKKNFGVWLDDAAGMICKCAEADALRSTFPTLMGGLHLRDEIIELEPETLAQRGSRLVAVAVEPTEPQTGNGREETPVEADKPKKTVAPAAAYALQNEVADSVTEAGFTFDQWQKWADEEFPAVQAGSLSSFEDLSANHAKLFQRGKLGMIAGLTKMFPKEAVV